MCLNDGNKTLINIRTGKESVLDLTLVSNNFASVWDWRVYKDGTTGSDHYPVICNISVVVKIDGRRGIGYLRKLIGKSFKQKVTHI